MSTYSLFLAHLDNVKELTDEDVQYSATDSGDVPSEPHHRKTTSDAVSSPSLSFLPSLLTTG